MDKRGVKPPFRAGDTSARVVASSRSFGGRKIPCLKGRVGMVPRVEGMVGEVWCRSRVLHTALGYTLRFSVVSHAVVLVSLNSSTLVFGTIASRVESAALQVVTRWLF